MISLLENVSNWLDRGNIIQVIIKYVNNSVVYNVLLNQNSQYDLFAHFL